MRILDLFCGAGGFSCGFKLLKKNDSFIGVDNNKLALQTYEYNIQGEIINQDINEIDLSVFGKVDILIGSPPCQDFSVANKFKTNDLTLVKKYLEILVNLKPKWWIMEEVSPVGKILIEEKLLSSKHVRYLKACEFNLPHVRRRLFAGNYPPVKKNMYRGRFFPTIIGRHPARCGNRSMNRWAKIYGVDRKNVISHMRGMIKTPVAQIRGYGHGKEDREKIKEKYVELGRKLGKGVDISEEKKMKFNDCITPELCAWVMGFPDGYKFFGSKTQQYKQIGNAVCPPISKAIYTAILKQKTLKDFFL